ncbi:hypothetical protein FPY71_14945 [Aureimonas fodinaquatilis]|uniref:Uncharacterized protein n=1 Tax=Aureimonas fodinaquatilis TaxID=2565783 RepID=A0A5B0DS99_9HYPH|nr:DUF6522 family protein [Aureimonas fodinaquatilis]KAA0968865.1 hypothetical protein FPY71_14945 [Aureimonas fodinaquatilis]
MNIKELCRKSERSGDDPLRPVVIERDANGEFTIEADGLAACFKRPVEEFRNLMTRGQVVSTVEAGQGDDAGRFRLTVRCGNQMWQAIVSVDGGIISQSTGFAPATSHSAKSEV